MLVAMNTEINFGIGFYIALAAVGIVAFLDVYHYTHPPPPPLPPNFDNPRMMGA